MKILTIALLCISSICFGQTGVLEKESPFKAIGELLKYGGKPTVSFDTLYVGRCFTPTERLYISEGGELDGQINEGNIGYDISGFAIAFSKVESNIGPLGSEDLFSTIALNSDRYRYDNWSLKKFKMLVSSKDRVEEKFDHFLRVKKFGKGSSESIIKQNGNYLVMEARFKGEALYNVNLMKRILGLPRSSNLDLLWDTLDKGRVTDNYYVLKGHAFIFDDKGALKTLVHGDKIITPTDEDKTGSFMLYRCYTFIPEDALN